MANHWVMFESLTRSGQDLTEGHTYFHKVRMFWILGMFQVASLTKWTDDHNFLDFRSDDFAKVDACVKSLTKHIRFYAQKRIYDYLAYSPKFRLLIGWLPTLGSRPWMSCLSRGRRTSIARLLTSQHRLVYETGRWTVPPKAPEERLCPHCVLLSQLDYRCPIKTSCLTNKTCDCANHTCLGTEVHYVCHCPLTTMHWVNLAINVNNLIGFWPMNVAELLQVHSKVTQNEWRIIGRQLAQAVENTLRDAHNLNSVVSLIEVEDARLRHL